MAGHVLSVATQAPEPQAVRLLDEDPDLGRWLRSHDEREAAEMAVASVILLPAGTSGLGGRLRPDPGGLGWLLLDGVILREVAVGDAAAHELIGPGDLLRARDLVADPDLVRHGVETEVLAPARLACLDRSFTAMAGRWPELITAIADRASARAVRVSVQQAASHLTRVDERLLVTLWLLAERWGRVTGEGVLVTLKLPHRTLARIIGAQRPTVTKAFRELTERGLIHRREDGRVVLAAAPDARLVAPPAEDPGPARSEAGDAGARERHMAIEERLRRARKLHEVQAERLASQTAALREATFHLGKGVRERPSRGRGGDGDGKERR